MVYSRADAEDIYIRGTIDSLLRSENGRNFINGLSITERVNDLNKATVELVRQAAEIAPEAATARQGWRDALSNLPNKEDVATLLEIAKKTELKNNFKIKIDYLELRNINNLNISKTMKNSRLFVAYYLNKVRLIDNI